MLKAALLAAAALFAPRLALADNPAQRGFDADASRPAVLADGAFAVETAAPQGRGTRRVELLLDYTRGLLSINSGDAAVGELVRDRLALHALGSFALGPLELGADLPLAVHQGSDLGLLTSRGVTGQLAEPIGSTTLGDLRLVGKAPFLRSAPLDLAAALDVRAVGPVRLDGSLGYLVRGRGQYLQLVARDGLTYGVAASVPLPRVGPLSTWRAIADVAGQWPRGLDLASARYRAPLSVRAGVRARVWRDLAVDVGAGTGVAWVGDAGYGRESIRLFAGLRWERLVVEPGRGPEGDRDGDGVPDEVDRCPDEPGPAQNDGCPPPPDEPVVEVETSRLSLKDAITFDTGRDTIRAESSHILDEIAKVLKAHLELNRVRVEGHTDNVGGRGYNRDLSQRRARSVVRALVQLGISAGRLEAEGYGFERPIAPNTTSLGRAKNRRVEFTIVDEKMPPVAPRT